MDGYERKQLQKEVGVDQLVEDIDYLRLCCGFSNVMVNTPKAEVRLRSGEIAQIPMQLSCLLNHMYVKLNVTFPVNYPANEPMHIQLELLQCTNANTRDSSSDSTSDMYDLVTMSDNMSVIECILQDYCSCRVGDRYIQCNELLIKLNEIVNGLHGSAIIQGISDSDNTTAANEDNDVATEQESYIYTCMLCRQHLFDHNELYQHEATEKDMGRRNGVKVPCTSYFLVKKPDWLLNCHENTGKITCIHCKSKLGQWSWSGLTCSCGRWIAPAFQFTCNRVDQKKL